MIVASLTWPLASCSCGLIIGRGDAVVDACGSGWSSHLFNLASVSQGNSFPMDVRFESRAIGGVGQPVADCPLFSSRSSVWSTPERRDSGKAQETTRSEVLYFNVKPFYEFAEREIESATYYQIVTQQIPRITQVSCGESLRSSTGRWKSRCCEDELTMMS